MEQEQNRGHIFILVRHSLRTDFLPSDVARLTFGADPTLLAFKSAQNADAFAAVLAERGQPVFRHGVRDKDEWSTLLTNLQGIGITHVAYDPQGIDPERYTINRAVFDNEFFG